MTIVLAESRRGAGARLIAAPCLRRSTPPGRVWAAAPLDCRSARSMPYPPTATSLGCLVWACRLDEVSGKATTCTGRPRWWRCQSRSARLSTSESSCSASRGGVDPVGFRRGRLRIGCGCGGCTRACGTGSICLQGRWDGPGGSSPDAWGGLPLGQDSTRRRPYIIPRFEGDFVGYGDQPRIRSAWAPQHLIRVYQSLGSPDSQEEHPLVKRAQQYPHSGAGQDKNQSHYGRTW